MRRVSLKVLLPILCSVALLFCVVGSTLASGFQMTWRSEKTEIDKILERDGYLEGIWFPWFEHSYLGHCLAPNKMCAEVLDNNKANSNWLKVGIDQYGAINIYREIYNLKALGFNIMGYEGSPYGEGVKYGPNGEVLGIEEEYIKNVRRLLDMCKEIGMPVLWSVTFHSTTLNDYYENGKYAWDIIAQAYAHPEIADQYVENFVKPLCKVLGEYPETVVMIASGVELENEINDSAIGNHFDADGRLLYGVNQDAMLYFLDAVTNGVNEMLPNVPVTNCGNSSDLTIYEGINLDFQGRNYYNIGARAPKIDELRATAPTIVTEFGLGDGVVIDDDLWTIKQIQFRDNFRAEGHRGWMYWDWSSTGKGGAYDLLAADALSNTDFRAGAFAIHYYVESYRAEHRGEELLVDKPVLFCNTGSGTVEWISSRQATSLDIQRSIDGGKTWKTVAKNLVPTDYEANFKGKYIDEEIANMQPDGTTVMYKMVARDDSGNTAESVPSNVAAVTGPPVNILADYNCDFENGMEGWQEFGKNGTYEDKANYFAQVIEPEGGAWKGKKALEFKLNHGYDADGKVLLMGDWSGIHLDGITVKPNTTYKLQLHYKIAPDSLFAEMAAAEGITESTEIFKMSGYLFIRGKGADGTGSGLGDIYDETIASPYMLSGSTEEWRIDDVTFRTNESDKLGLDFRAVSYAGIPVHYYIDSIELYEVV
ncbi:MAG: hypothetical protein IJN76_04425 [Clostridia bacterium]|nr:hypothetical protein [Clostridia bacterium]